MRRCWRNDPHRRPGFAEILKLLGARDDDGTGSKPKPRILTPVASPVPTTRRPVKSLVDGGDGMGTEVLRPTTPGNSRHGPDRPEEEGLPPHSAQQEAGWGGAGGDGGGDDERDTATLLQGGSSAFHS